MRPNKPTTLREFQEKLNNARITGHISGRHLILLGGKEDREWDGGGYEENDYRFLDEYIESFLTSHSTELISKIEGLLPKHGQTVIIEANGDILD